MVMKTTMMPIAMFISIFNAMPIAMFIRMFMFIAMFIPMPIAMFIAMLAHFPCLLQACIPHTEVAILLWESRAHTEMAKHTI